MVKLSDQKNRYFLAITLLLAISLIPTEFTPRAKYTEPPITTQLQEHNCLALNIYWEARSEPLLGQYAIAAVTLNRMRSAAFPNTICKVVRQGGEFRNRCQFSWWCDGKSDKPNDRIAWDHARKIAWSALRLPLQDPTRGALYYHASYVNPDWARSMIPTTKIGEHQFYLSDSNFRI